jgi:NUMOD3 motif
MENGKQMHRNSKRSGKAQTTAQDSNDPFPSAETTSSDVPSADAAIDPTVRLRKKPKTIRILENVDEDDGDSPAATKKKKLRRVDFAAEDDTYLLGNPAVPPLLDDLRPTALRLTEKGGYLHTKQSRMKISQANQGKSPWNKGKERTDTAKAKISAGVKARNHALLLQKLQTLHMTEEEWYAKKKQVKLMRERVRKAKIAAAKFEQEQLELKQKKETAVSVTEEDLNVATSTTVPTEANVDESDAKPKATVSQKPLPEESTPTVPEEELPPPPMAHEIPAFAPDVQWTHHVLDTPNLKYDMLCPHGGPGGLICCHSCMVQYSKYMTSTLRDLERCATAKVEREVQELLDDTVATKQRLVQTMKVARRKPIPIRHYTMTSQVSSRKAAAAEPATELDAPRMEFPDILVQEEI